MTPGWLGVDLGTQGVRAVLVGDDGHRFGVGRAALTGTRTDDRHEQDPHAWWTATVAAVRAALAGAADVAVLGVAVDATSGSFTLLDRDDRPLLPGVMYDDGRGAAAVGRVDHAGRERWRAAGYRRMQPTWALPRLVAVLDELEVPDGTRLAHQTDVVNRRLTGEPDLPTDTSSALKTGVDAAAVAWPEEVMAALGVPAGLLPPVVLPGTVIGAVGPAAAAATGLAAGVPVVAGTTDGCAAQLGTGAVAPGDLSAALGTTLVLKGVTDGPVSDPDGVVYAHRSPTGQWLPGGASSVGAGVVSREVADADLDRLSGEAGALLPTRWLRYPLAGTGERFPFLAPDAHALDLGQGPPAERFAALLQGVAHVERLCVDQLDRLGVPTGGRRLLSGGAAANDVWNRLRADVAGVPLEVPRDPEAALGAALLARVGVTGEPVADLARRMVHVDRVVEPRPDGLARHREGYLRFVGELERRGWLPAEAARHARARAEQTVPS